MTRVAPHRLFWGAGAKTDPGNEVDIIEMLFMWTILPAFSAVAYVPASILERATFYRCALLP